MAAAKRARPEKGFFASLEGGESIKEDKLIQKKEKVDTEKVYPIEIVDRDKASNKIKIHFVGYDTSFDEWRDAKETMRGEKSSKLCRATLRFKPSIGSLPDRASVFFYNLAKAIKVGLYSTKKDSPEVRIEERVDSDIYEDNLKDIGVVKRLRGKNMHAVNNNADLCHILGDKWFERIININGDFCYVVAGTVRFWLTEKRPVKEFFYVGDHLLEHHISNDLLLIFNFVRGDGVKAEYKTNQWK